ncbi:MAG TPA: DUF3027 domain-containing protein [Pseudonocardia sp.]|nr:DUF3027 domain-containing protein [Pseudonocardia sp.]
MTAAATVETPARLADAVAEARAAAVDEAAVELGAGAGEEAVGEHLDVVPEPGGAVTHLFAARQGGYRGWRWSVTLACAGGEEPVTVSEVALLPGPDAVVAPAWVPWQERVRPGDLGVGDLLPAAPDDPRLVSAHVAVEEEDPEVATVAREVELGRPRVLGPVGRAEAAGRWHSGPHGPASDMARGAPAPCGTCGFLLPVAGSLRAAFGVCGNEFSPADGAVVAVDFGCGAHSDVAAEPVSPVTVAELVYDDGVDLEPQES